MPPIEAEATQESPLTTEGGFPVSEELSMADRVAAAKERYRAQQPIDPRLPNPLGKTQLAYISEMVEAADASAEAPQTSRKPDGPIAPVRRKGTPPPIAGAPVEAPRPRRVRKPRKPAAEVPSQLEDISDEDLLREAGVVPFYSTTETAQFFDRTTQWMYWGLGRDDDQGMPPFVHPDGKPITPERIGDPASGRRRFTLDVIRDILLSSYRRGNIEPDELKKILRRIRINELGGEWREREGWHRIRGKWVHPEDCVKVGGVWTRKKKSDSEDSSEGSKS